MNLSTSAYWFIFQNDHLLLVRQDEKSYSLPDISSLSLPFLRQHQLGQFNQIDYFAAEIASDFPLPATISLIPLRKAFDLLGVDWYNPIIKAFSVLNWDRNHQFCSRCGNQTKHESQSFERVCTACGMAFYPRISPSIIVLIRKGEQLLMARSPHFVPGAYGLIAGFVEVGETVEDAVHREVKEEVNIEIKNLQYFGSQPWPFPDSLMLGFVADYAAGEIQIDKKEIEDAGWYHYDNLPGRPSTRSTIAKHLIDYFVAEQRKLKGS